MDMRVIDLGGGIKILVGLVGGNPVVKPAEEVKPRRKRLKMEKEPIAVSLARAVAERSAKADVEAKAARRSAGALKAWETRRARKAAEDTAKADRRSAGALKAWETRRAKAQCKAVPSPVAADLAPIRKLDDSPNAVKARTRSIAPPSGIDWFDLREFTD